jgi:hypothetical protein
MIVMGIVLSHEKIVNFADYTPAGQSLFHPDTPVCFRAHPKIPAWYVSC